MKAEPFRAIIFLPTEKQQLKRKGRKVRREIQHVGRVPLLTRLVTAHLDVFPLRSLCCSASPRSTAFSRVKALGRIDSTPSSTGDRQVEHRLTRVALSLALGLLVSAAASAASLSIANPGFEQLALDDGNWVFTLPGWANSGDSGTFDPTVAQYPNQNAYEGENVAFSSLEGPWISQVLAEVLQANTRYVLTVRVGSRSDAPFAGYAIELRAGSTVLSVDDNTLQPPAGTFLASAIAYSSGANDGMIGQPLEVRFRSFGRQVNFDDVSLTAQPIPEPSTYLLFAGGLAAVVGYTRRKAA